MTTVGMHYDVIPGKEAVFEETFAGVLDVIRSADGHVESHLYRDTKEPSIYLILSEWNSKEAYAAFLNSDAFKATIKFGKEQVLKGRPRHRVFGEGED